MTKLRKLFESEYTPFIRVLFGQSSPTPVPLDLKDPSEGVKHIQFIDPTLNDSQKDAIRFAIASEEVALIHGPPGVKKYLSKRLPDTQLIKADRQDPHPHRAYSTASSTETPPASLWSFQHIC